MRGFQVIREREDLTILVIILTMGIVDAVIVWLLLAK